MDIDVGIGEWLQELVSTRESRPNERVVNPFATTQRVENHGPEDEEIPPTERAFPLFV